MPKSRASLKYSNNDGPPRAANSNSRVALIGPKRRQLGGNTKPRLSEAEARVLTSTMAEAQAENIARQVGSTEIAVKEHVKAILRKVRGH